MSFKTNPITLKELLRDVEKGKIQLPDFQRDWVWSDEGVRQLIASIAAGFPVGAILTLESGGKIKFKPRRLAHTPKTKIQPEKLLLDGQQRLTSCYQALMSKKPVKAKNSKGKKSSSFYFIDMRRAIELDSRLENCIVVTDAKLISRKSLEYPDEIDLSKKKKQFSRDMFPLNLMFNSRAWFRDYQEFNKEDGFEIYSKFDDKILDQFQQYKIPTIELSKSNSREAVCTIFEKVNVGGEKLDAFELLTAIFAADKFNLRDDLRGKKKTVGRIQRIIGKDKDGALAKISERDFLQVMVLLQTYNARKAAENKNKERLPVISMKEDALLRLETQFYKDNADEVELGFDKCRKFLSKLCIHKSQDMPTIALAKTLASVFTVMGKKNLNIAQTKKLTQWFWCVAIGGVYGSSTDTRVIRDLVEIVPWLSDKEAKTPSSIVETSIHLWDLESLRSRASSAYKAVNAAILSQGCKDFRTGDKASDLRKDGDPIDIHHIYPKDWCLKQNIEKEYYDNIFNKTPLDRSTNRRIKNDAPSDYYKKLLEELKKHAGGSKPKLKSIFESHLIDQDLLVEDDFFQFYEDRKRRVIELIEKLTDKKVYLDEEED